MAVADAVSARKDIDGNRMMAMGGSFGGYISNWIGTQTDRIHFIQKPPNILAWYDTISAFLGRYMQ